MISNDASIHVESLRESLANNGRKCDRVEEILSSLKQTPNWLEELRCDIVDQQAAISTLDTLLEDNSASNFPPSPASYSPLSHLTSLLPSHSNLLVSIEEHILRWHESCQTGGDDHSLFTEIAQVREKLSGMRAKLNITIALANWLVLCQCFVTNVC